MTPREQAAYDAGIRAVIDMARITAVTIETAPVPQDLRKQAAAGALYAFADAAGALTLTLKPDPVVAAMAIIGGLPGDQGEIPCPECSGRFRWIRDSTNRHIHGRCEAGCLTVMQ